MTWQLGAALNAAIGACYLMITWLIVRGLWTTRQLGSNRLALATGAIFFTCGIHHAGHAVHVLLPSVGIDAAHGLAMRRAFTWQMDAWDVIGAAVAAFYLTLRRSYGALLGQPEMFENAERQRYERALEQERAMLAEAQQIAAVGSWSWERQRGPAAWSEQMYRIFNRDPADGPLPDAELAEIVHPEDLQQMRRIVGPAVVAGAGFELDLRIRVDGDPADVRHLHVIAHPDVGGGYVGTTQDVSTVRRTQQALRAAQERLRVTVAHAPIGVALVELGGTSGRLLSVNGPLCELVGYREEELLEMGLHSVVHPDDAGTLVRDLTLLASDDQARIELELRCVHRTGRPVWTLLTGATVPNEGEAPCYAVFHVLDITERKRFEVQLLHLADHDALTGLYNRRRFEQELARTVAEARRYQRSAALLLIDLDGFKYVNDTLGHSYGDELLTRVAGGLRAVLRDTDVLGRLGGDEFAVIVPEADVDQARRVAEKVLTMVAERAAVVSGHRQARVTASIGITTFVPDDGISAEDLVVEADLAMYEAKDGGKNRVAVYDRGRDVRGGLLSRHGWLERLRDAIANEGFQLMAQPVVGICAGGIPRFELLLRMRGDEGELIAPGTFLGIAERFDLIQDIDRWVVREAVRLLALHYADGHEISLSVNMSARTLGDPGIVEHIAGLLDDCPVPHGALVIEVTETAAIGNIDLARNVARGLRELGCRFALDDFGAGFASFYYLKYLEFDFLKIDGEFIAALGHDPTDNLVVRSVVDIARGLGAQTIAECVGSAGALEKLERLGVDFGQGYFLGVPMPVARMLPALVGR